VTGASRSPLASVTVAGPSLLWADVLATAPFVRGADAAPAVAADGYEVLLVHRDGAVVHLPPG
jgi:thiamine biosynthesis lipoprotein